MNADWPSRQAEYEKEKKAAEARHAAWEQDVQEAVKTKQPPPLPPDAVEPKSPTLTRLSIVDATVEKIARILGENPVREACPVLRRNPDPLAETIISVKHFTCAGRVLSLA